MTTQTNEQNSSSNSLTESLANAAGKRAKQAVGVGVAAAAVAGAVVLRAFRNNLGSGGSDEESIFHLKQLDDQWALMLEGETEPEATFPTKDEGLAAARELAQKSAPCELVIYRVDGTVQGRHAYQS